MACSRCSPVRWRRRSRCARQSTGCADTPTPNGSPGVPTPSAEVYHFSEDPTITRFEPHVAATAQEPDAYVWAVDEARCPDYWFPRQCPRAMAWVGPDTTDADRDRIIGAGCVHPGARRRV